jgi:hypothetical protein
MPIERPILRNDRDKAPTPRPVRRDHQAESKVARYRRGVVYFVLPCTFDEAERRVEEYQLTRYPNPGSWRYLTGLLLPMEDGTTIYHTGFVNEKDDMMGKVTALAADAGQGLGATEYGVGLWGDSWQVGNGRPDMLRIDPYRLCFNSTEYEDFLPEVSAALAKADIQLGTQREITLYQVIRESRDRSRFRFSKTAQVAFELSGSVDQPVEKIESVIQEIDRLVPMEDQSRKDVSLLIGGRLFKIRCWGR